MSPRAECSFDWDRYWSSQEPPKSLVRGGERMAARIVRFVHLMDPGFVSLADFGCGPAVMLFKLALGMPDRVFYGFDASYDVLSIDRNRAATGRFKNLHFHYAHLPGIPTSKQFDVVTCFATLHYIRAPTKAIRALYRTVRPGGYLIFNYPNKAQQAAYRRDARDDAAVRRRFALVLSGTNLLSKSLIEQTLGRQVKNFWSVLGEPIQPQNPCVVVRRPAYSAGPGLTDL